MTAAHPWSDPTNAHHAITRVRAGGNTSSAGLCTGAPKVEYSLTELGRSLEPVLYQMAAWGTWYCEQNGMEHWTGDDVEERRHV
ncbi:MAG TPA: winged helix-turn-helix transcriptional regulator [Ktedonobacteraceae bacterium]|nr:winged helix-turn-helix transcriptional regulator [Ktedonobacteraceae bacterium]